MWSPGLRDVWNRTDNPRNVPVRSFSTKFRPSTDTRNPGPAAGPTSAIPRPAKRMRTSRAPVQSNHPTAQELKGAKTGIRP